MIRKILSFGGVFVAVFIGCAVYAQAPNYTVRDVQVQATAADGTAARMAALSQGEGEAFTRLLQQLLPPEQAAARRAAVSPEAISAMVQGYDVRDEKVSGTGYAATVDVTFNPASVNRIISAASVNLLSPPVPTGATPAAMPAAPAAQVLSVLKTPQPAAVLAVSRRTVLVLPVWKSGGNTLLWEPENAWRGLWNGLKRQDVASVRLPIGDESDRMMLGAAQASIAPFDAFAPIAERYQASAVIVAEASESTADNGMAVLDVKLRNLERTGDSAQMLRYEQNGNETRAEMLARAAAETMQRLLPQAPIQTASQAVAPARGGASMQSAPANAPKGRMTILSRLSGLKDWVELRKRLSALPNVEQVELSALSSGQADIVLYYRGGAALLENNMQAQGLKVAKARRYWIVGF